MAQLDQFTHATAERGVVFDEVVRGTAGTLGAVQSLADGGVELLPSVRADLLAKLGRGAEARAEFERAAAMALNGRERELLLARARGFEPG